MNKQTGISINLPDIHVDAITSLDEAKKIITLLLNIIEQQAKQITILEERIILLEKEIAVLKQQPRKPEFERPQNTSFSASKLLKKEKHWHKSVKKGSIEIDQDVSLPEVDRCVCGSTEFTTMQTTTKIVQGMLMKRNNTAYHGRKKKCVTCGRIYKTSIPPEIKGLSFDSDTQSLASFLKFACRFTHPLLYNFFTGFGIKISYGELTEIVHRNSQKLHPAYSHLRTVGIKQSSYIQSDATCSKRKQLATQEIINQHLHFVGNKFLSLFKITKLYNAEVMNGLLGRHGRRKLYVSDDASPNGRKLKVKKKQVCWVHEDRHYLKLSPRFKIHKEKLQSVISQLLEFYHISKAYKENPTTEGKKKLRSRFDTIVRQQTGYTALDHQLLLTKRKRDRLLLFLDYPFLPIHNNQCEQDLREFVIIRKISGETKSLAGDRSIERHLSVIQTARKQGLNIFETLHGLLTGTLSPVVLTARFV
jgi:hypothetical protein